jgi:hypothetical protein
MRLENTIYDKEPRLSKPGWGGEGLTRASMRIIGLKTEVGVGNPMLQ